MKCAEKVRYNTRTKAKKTAKIAMLQRKVKLYVYMCNECNYWHLTRFPRSVKNAN